MFIKRFYKCTVFSKKLSWLIYFRVKWNFFCVFIRGSCESYYRPAPCRYASEGHCGKCMPLGYFSHHCSTGDERRRISGKDNKALKIRESYATCKQCFLWMTMCFYTVINIKKMYLTFLFFVLRRRFSVSKMILQS